MQPHKGLESGGLAATGQGADQLDWNDGSSHLGPDSVLRCVEDLERRRRVWLETTMYDVFQNIGRWCAI